MFRNTHIEDCFVSKVSHIEGDNFEGTVLTKRQMLSDISKTFDPLGWLSPDTPFLKQGMRTTWEASISWHKELPSELVDHYLMWRSKMDLFKGLGITTICIA